MFTHTAIKADEEPIRFESQRAQLHGMLHHASEAARGAILLCPADGEERAWSQRTYVRLARALAEEGFAVLRFDYAGQGESAGAYEETDVQTRLSDIAAASEILRRRSPHTRLGLLGLRLGAALALEATAHDSGIGTLVLWEPVFEPDVYIQNLLRVNLTMQMVLHKKVLKEGEQLSADLAAGGRVNVNGYNLTHAFVNGLANLRPADRLSRFRGTAVIMCSPHARVPGSGAEVLRRQFPPFWKEPRADMTPPHVLIAGTKEWIRRQCTTELQ